MLPLKKGEICGYFVSLHDVHIIITHRENIKFIFLAWEETRMTFQCGLYVEDQI